MNKSVLISICALIFAYNSGNIKGPPLLEIKSMRREVDLVVISDVHLGTYGSRAEELVKYLRSIKPKTLVLNGDIIDIWQFSKRYFPAWVIEVEVPEVPLLHKNEVALPAAVNWRGKL